MAGGHRGQRAPGAPLSAAAGAGRRPRPETRAQRPAPSLLPVRRASSSGPGPWCSPGAAGPRPGPEKAPRCPREARALSLPPRSPRPRDFGAPARPRRPGSTRASSSGSGGRSGLPLGWPASPPWAASPGGPHGSSPPKFACPGRKGFPLQCTKASRPGRALKSPSRGGGWLEAGERGGGAAAGGEGRSAGLADERGADGCRTAATNVFAEKFCSQVGGREIVTHFKVR